MIPATRTKKPGRSGENGEETHYAGVAERGSTLLEWPPIRAWNGDVEIRLEGIGRQFLAEKRPVVTVHYAQGPLLAPAGKPEIPDYEQLAVFETEMTKNGAPAGVMKGTTAAARGVFGQGRVFCFSPHPEQTGRLDHYIEAAMRWVAESQNSPAKSESK